MSKFIRILMGAAALPLSIVTFGCAAPTQADDTAFADEAIGETSSALCSDTAVAADATLTIGGQQDSQRVTSPNANYGTSACKSSYVVDVRDTKGKTLQIQTSWGENLPTLKDACPLAFVTATLYGERPGFFVKIGGVQTWVAPAWIKIGEEKTATGVWSPARPPGSIGGAAAARCGLELATSSNIANYNKIRVVAKAAAFAIIAIPTKKVTVAVTNPEFVQ